MALFFNTNTLYPCNDMRACYYKSSWTKRQQVQAFTHQILAIRLDEWPGLFMRVVKSAKLQRLSKTGSFKAKNPLKWWLSVFKSSEPVSVLQTHTHSRANPQTYTTDHCLAKPISHHFSPEYNKPLQLINKAMYNQGLLNKGSVIYVSEAQQQLFHPLQPELSFYSVSEAALTNKT